MYTVRDRTMKCTLGELLGYFILDNNSGDKVYAP